jgi:hypothetical protein
MRALILLPLLMTLSACGDKDAADCSNIGCGSDNETATFALEEPAGGWAADQEVTYRFFVGFDDEEEICAGTPGTGIWCDGEHNSVYVDPTSDGEGNALSSLVLSTMPETVTLVIERGDAEVVNQSFTIEPDLSYPNGEGCEPVCSVWSGTVDSW